MRKQAPQEHSARVVAIALAAWGIAVAAAAAEGVLTAMSPSTLAGLAGFAMIYAPATFYLDRALHEFVLGAMGRFIAAGAAALDVALAVAALALAGEEGAWLANAARPPFALAAFFAAPLAAVLNLAWLERTLRVARRSRARSPGATPAST